MSKLGRVALYVYALACALWIYAWPRNKYEWMLDEPGTSEGPRNACALPLDPDAACAPLVAIAPALLLLAAALFMSFRCREWHMSLWLTAALVLGWLCKFFVPSPSC